MYHASSRLEAKQLQHANQCSLIYLYHDIVYPYHDIVYPSYCSQSEADLIFS